MVSFSYKIDIPKGEVISLNHPHDPRGITTFDNMKSVAETCLESLIPQLMKKNIEPIKQFLSTHNSKSY